MVRLWTARCWTQAATIRLFCSGSWTAWNGSVEGSSLSALRSLFRHGMNYPTAGVRIWSGFRCFVPLRPVFVCSEGCSRFTPWVLPATIPLLGVAPFLWNHSRPRVYFFPVTWAGWSGGSASVLPVSPSVLWGAWYSRPEREIRPSLVSCFSAPSMTSVSSSRPSMSWARVTRPLLQIASWTCSWTSLRSWRVCPSSSWIALSPRGLRCPAPAGARPAFPPDPGCRPAAAGAPSALVPSRASCRPCLRSGHLGRVLYLLVPDVGPVRRARPGPDPGVVADPGPAADAADVPDLRPVPLAITAPASIRTLGPVRASGSTTARLSIHAVSWVPPARLPRSLSSIVPSLGGGPGRGPLRRPPPGPEAQRGVRYVRASGPDPVSLGGRLPRPAGWAPGASGRSRTARHGSGGGGHGWPQRCARPVPGIRGPPDPGPGSAPSAGRRPSSGPSPCRRWCEVRA